MKICIGTRGSKLALIQAERVVSRLESLVKGLEVELCVIKTEGDRILDSPLSGFLDKGLFVKEIEAALLRGEVDAGVHSLKDMPTEQPEGLVISATLEREIPLDAFVSLKYASLTETPSAAVIGTSSPRRKSQILHLRPDLLVRDIRGNVDTRLGKLERGEYDGLVMAAAGLKRLELEDRIAEILPPERMIPAVGQGVIAVETREKDEKMLDFCRLVDHEDTAKAAREEREFLQAMGGGCRVPVGCYAYFKNDLFLIKGFIAETSGKDLIARSLETKRGNCRGAGKVLAGLIRENGGDRILKEIRK